MPGDPKECREHAKRCWALAGETKSPVVKESLEECAQTWARLVSEMEATRALVEKWGSKPDKQTG